MAELHATDIRDLVAGTLYEYGPPNFQQIAQSMQTYQVMGTWLKTDKIVEDEGIGIQRTLMDRTLGAARHLGQYEVDDVQIGDHLVQLNVPWVHAQTAWGYEHREILMNRGKALVTKVVEPRQSAAMIDIVEELEAKGWSAPAVANKSDPYGVPYWIVKNATTGFNGALPSDHTTVGGIDLDDHPNFKNYTALYTAVTKANLIKLMRTAHRKIMWKSPVNINEYRGTKGTNYKLYTGESLLSDLEDLGEAQNENLGRDLAPMDDTMTFRRHALEWVPQLDADTSNPVYFVNHSTFFPIVLKGDNLRQTGPLMHPLMHNVDRVFIDLTYNFVCVDRRRNAVLSLSA